MVVGPLDRRTHKTRCSACARRRIKCEGGPPCLYCTKKKFTCMPQVTNTQTGPVFVNQAPNAEESNGFHFSSHQSTPALCSGIGQDTTSRFTNHFFTDFLVRNDFGVVYLDLETIKSQFQSIPSLYHASVAVGALGFANTFSSGIEKREAKLKALNSYRTSVLRFQIEIQRTRIQKSDSCLWTSMFLGLFELMVDATGHGWLRHVLYGTSKILQLRGPNAHLSGLGRSFFLTYRLFEICRSCFYPEPTFLDQERWRSLMDRMWEGDMAVEWHPKENLLDILISCSSLGFRICALLKPDSSSPDEDLDEALLTSASKGIAIRIALNQWLDDFNDWLSVDPARTKDTRSTLATIYFHAISIYLSGLFDYRPYFNQVVSASIPFEEIQVHVQSILQTTELALKTTNLVGVAYFFPLRVAGARTRSSEQMFSILQMLDRISERNFVVAQAFSEDLRALWEERMDRAH